MYGAVHQQVCKGPVAETDGPQLMAPQGDVASGHVNVPVTHILSLRVESRFYSAAYCVPAPATSLPEPTVRYRTVRYPHG